VSTATVPVPVRPRRPGAPVAAVVVAGVLALVSLGLFVASGVLLWGESRKDADGFVATASEQFVTPTPALVTGDLDLDLGDSAWALGSDHYGKARVEVTPRNGKRVFVGVAPTREVDAYLRGTAHSTLTDIDLTPFRAEYRRQAGAPRATPPGRERFWAASATGAGAQTMTWDVEDGSWSVVVMNADGSRGVDAAVSAGAKLPPLGTAGWIALGTGVVLLAGAVGLVVLAVREPRG
jgi:hypothetical protein